MIRDLALTDVGPTRSLSFDFSKRLNVLTGDNGLGKTFVLDVIWWVLTDSWVARPALPWRPRSLPATAPPSHAESRLGPVLGPTDVERSAVQPGISARLVRSDTPDAQGKPVLGLYSRGAQAWMHSWQDTREGDGSSRIRETVPQLVLYARSDGAFAVWDAYQATGTTSEAVTVLDSEELWRGKQESVLDLLVSTERERTLIRGLLEDWVSWQGTNAPEFVALCETLTLLSDPAEPLVPGKPGRVFLNDRRDIPMLSMPYGDVPVTLASAGMKRVLGLAYLLVWAWSEHRKAAELTQREPVREMTLLIDEVELHLHPSWQRLLLPAVLRAIDKLAPDCAVQVFATTHSPMVLASLESVFDESIDDLFVLERDKSSIRAVNLPFAKAGNVGTWLATEAFDKVGPRPREGELAVQAATRFMDGEEAEAERLLVTLIERYDALPESDAAGDDEDADAQRLDIVRGEGPLFERIQAALEATLPGLDTFWVQWNLMARRVASRRGAAG